MKDKFIPIIIIIQLLGLIKLIFMGRLIIYDQNQLFLIKKGSKNLLGAYDNMFNKENC